MYTEEEAKTKWCPFARTVERWPDSGISVARNRVAHIIGDGELDKVIRPFGCECIASECMAWRWNEEWKVQPERPNGPGWELWETSQTQNNAKWVKRHVGFCGLAGVPQ